MCAQCNAFRCTLVCVCEDIEDTQLPLPSKNKLDVPRSRLLLLEYFSFFKLQEISLHTDCHLSLHTHIVALAFNGSPSFVALLALWCRDHPQHVSSFHSLHSIECVFFRFALLFCFCFGRCHCYCGWMKANEMWKWNRLINKKKPKLPAFSAPMKRIFRFFSFLWSLHNLRCSFSVSMKRETCQCVRRNAPAQHPQHICKFIKMWMRTRFLPVGNSSRVVHNKVHQNIDDLVIGLWTVWW